MAKKTDEQVAFLRGREELSPGRDKDMPGRQMVMFAPGRESTDLALMVDALAHEETQPWHPSRIRDALVKEAGVEPGLAGEIASEVESDLLRWGRDRVTTSLVRELVNVKLFQRGLDAKLQDHSRIGIPVHDLETMMLNPNRENSNTTHNPESINLSIAELALKQYALTKVFSRDVAEAHLSGTIHLHDLGMVNRPYCSGQSIAYVAKFGLNLPSITSISKPAKHPDVLLAHLLKMTSVLQNNFAGAIGWDAVNTFFAPYLTGLSEERVHKLAQMLIFEFNHLAGGRGGLVAFKDINLYYEIPKHFRDVPAIGPGGVETGKTYGDYAAEAKSFLKALFRVYLEGDSRGRVLLPQALLHIPRISSARKGGRKCSPRLRTLRGKGKHLLCFRPGGVVKLSECCRLSFELDDEDLLMPGRRGSSVLRPAERDPEPPPPRLPERWRQGNPVRSRRPLHGDGREGSRPEEEVPRRHPGPGQEGPPFRSLHGPRRRSLSRLDKAKYLIGILGVNEWSR